MKRSVTKFVTRTLRLQVNTEKSAVGRPWHRKYLGFCFTNDRNNPRIRVHWKTVKRFRQRVRQITARSRGRSVEQVVSELKSYFRGWWQYFGIAESLNRLAPLDHWVRRRLRALIWTQWKSRPEGDWLPGTKWNGSNAAKRSGNTPAHAGHPPQGRRSVARPGPDHRLFPQGQLAHEQGQMGSHRPAGRTLPLARTCLPLERVRLISRTAAYGPVRAVVWEGLPERGVPIPMALP